MTEWKHRPTLSEYHPFKKEYETMLDADRDYLLELIEHYIQMRREAIEKERGGDSSIDNFFAKKMVDNPIEVYYWKFLNKETRINESE